MSKQYINQNGDLFTDMSSLSMPLIVLPEGGSMYIKTDNNSNNNKDPEKGLEVHFDSTFSDTKKQKLSEFIQLMFGLFYMPERIKMTENRGIKISIDTESKYEHNDKLIKFRYDNDQNSSLFPLIHELLHACIAEINFSLRNKHSNRIYKGLCNNLLIFSANSPGGLVDIKTLLRANFKSPVNFYPSELKFLIPPVHFIYKIFTQQCSILEETQIINKTSRILNEKGRKVDIINTRKGMKKHENNEELERFFNEKFSAEYEFLKKYVRGPKQEYVKKNTAIAIARTSKKEIMQHK